FFFQAEDGIRDGHVTGVQTCALPIYVRISYVNRSPETLHDFYVHQYLNAFRPGSRWAAADSAEQRERFQHLKDPDYAFERITSEIGRASCRERVEMVGVSGALKIKTK